LGWRPSFFSEIDKFPRAVLAHHYPEVPCHGDFTSIKAGEYDPIDLLVGGTPCQSFSVAGLRGGLADDRGNLALEYLRLAQRLRPKWLVWENVPGVLSSAGGRDFGSILGGLVELGYGFAYRVLDAQFFGVPQRRRRVFVVGYLGDWRRAAAVLFERHSLQGHSPPRREAGQRAAPTISARTEGGGGLGTDFDLDGGLIAFGGNNTSGPIDIAAALNSKSTQRQDFETETLITGALACSGGHAYPGTTAQDAGEGFLLPVAFSSKDHGADAGYISPTLRAMGHSGSHANAGGQVAIAFGSQMSTPHWQHDISDTLQAKNPKAMSQGSAVRRLTPMECERLQGFPDDYTAIGHRKKAAADGPRYKALGNSMAVPVMRWIGERIAMVEAAQEAAE
jgi:DNA (cytosine-5)-methyltransferase 1